MVSIISRRYQLAFEPAPNSRWSRRRLFRHYRVAVGVLIRPTSSRFYEAIPSAHGTGITCRPFQNASVWSR